MIRVHSEIKPLKKVMLHRPNDELLYLTPSNLKELLFDDIPDLYKAQKEHDEFVAILESNGVEVVYLENLMAEVLDQNPEIKEGFIKQYIHEAGIYTDLYQTKLFEYLSSIEDNLTLVIKTMSGITFKDIGEVESNELIDLVDTHPYLVTNPMPNLYFTRDNFSSIGKHMSVNKMFSDTRNRETIYGDYIVRYHKDFQEVLDVYGRNSQFSIEGGDILVISDELLFIGISERTQPEAIQQLAKNLFFNFDTNVNKIIAFEIPNQRAMMHLDTVMTQIDEDVFVVHPGILKSLKVFELKKLDNDIKITQMTDSLENILKEALNLESVTLLECGAGDPIASVREQWTDGSNTLTLAPGKVVAYKRNYITNQLMRDHGIEVFEIDADNLTVGRGGPRCMSMPFIRD